MSNPHTFTLPTGETIPLEDTVCECGHWYDEHDLAPGSPLEEAWCAVPGCNCESCRPSARESSPEAIADRGGDPESWPAHVKRAFAS